MVRVVLPELRIGPPRTRWRRERETVVTEGEALLLLQREQGARIVGPEETKAADESLASLSAGELRKRLAAAGVAESDITGTGRGGRVVKSDLVAALEAAS